MGGLPGFVQRLNALFDSKPDPSTGRPYTNVAVADALAAQGVAVTHSYLGQLRNGRKTEPSASLVGALAAFFGVSADYFFGTFVRFEGSELPRRLGILRQRSASNFAVDELAAQVEQRGEQLSGSDWNALLESHGVVHVRQTILEAIADYFEVPREYLLSPARDSRVELVEAQMDLVDAVAETGGTGVSMRSVGEPTPEALRAIAAALRAARAGD